MTIKSFFKSLAGIAVTAVVAALFAAPASAAGPPVVTYTIPVEADYEEARLHGTVNPNGADTLYAFQYGTTKEYGTSVPLPVPKIPAGTSAVGIHETIESLLPNTVYHYRIVAGNVHGITYGPDQTFKTVGRPAFEASTYPATVVGSQASQELETEVGEVECGQVSFSRSISSSTSDLYFQPDLKNCWIAAIPASAQTNGCYYGFHVDNAGSGSPYKGTLSLDCEEGQQLEFAAGSCIVKVPPQSLGTVTYENKLVSTLRVIAQTTGSGIEYSYSGWCGSGSSTGAFRSEMKLEGTTGKSATNFFVNGRASIGIYMSGSASGEEAMQPKFDGDKFPVKIIGSQGGYVHGFETKFGELNCAYVGVSGTATGKDNELSVDPEYRECSLSESPAKVVTDGCHYTYQVANVGPPYKGAMDLVCEAGHQLEIISGSCTVRFASQTIGTAVTYENRGSGNGRHIVADAYGGGLAYSYSGSCGSGSANDGSHWGNTRLEGYP